MHNVLQLSNRETENDNRPAQLIELEFDVSDLHGSNGHDKGTAVEEEGYRRQIMSVLLKGMELCIALNDNFSKEISVSVENSHGEPKPLGSSKEWDGILNGVEVSAVTDLDQFSELNVRFNLWAGEEILVS